MRLHLLSLALTVCVCSALCSPAPHSSPRLKLLWEEGMYEWMALHAQHLCAQSHAHTH